MASPTLPPAQPPSSRIPEFAVEAFADPVTVKDVVKGILHTIFFHRFFPTVVPLEQEVLDGVSVPKVSDAELETLIDSHSGLVARQLDAERSGRGTGTGLRTQVIVTFRDKKRPGLRRGRVGTGGGLTTSPGSSSATFSPGGAASGVSTASPSASPTTHTSSKPWYASAAAAGLGLVTNTIAGTSSTPAISTAADDAEEIIWERWIIRVSVAEPKTESDRIKVRRAAEQTLASTVMKIVSVVNNHKDHIPPITTTDANPFPYAIDVSASASTNAHVGPGMGVQKGSRAGAGGTGQGVGLGTGWSGRLFSGY